MASMLLLTACKDHSSSGEGHQKPTAAEMLNEPITSIIGTWSGMFMPILDVKLGDTVVSNAPPPQPNKITVFIDRMENGEMSGHSVCAGNDRPFKGTYKETAEKIVAVLDEPGDNKYDGKFEWTIDKAGHSIGGLWTPRNQHEPTRTYGLTRKNFAYNQTAGDHPECSTRLLTEDDVNNLLKDELWVMRNEIYARHGYSFKLRAARDQFDNKDWYMPIATDVRKSLSAIELKNQALIKRFEKVAEESYDDYGR